MTECLTVDEHVLAINLIKGKISQTSSIRNKYRFGAQIRDHQQAIIKAYASARGWTISRAQFSLDCLTQDRMHGGQQYTLPSIYIDGIELCDHITCFKFNQRPVAIVTQPYLTNTPEYRDKAIAWGKENGLCINFPTDFPSWRNPGMTTLIEITRLVPVDRPVKPRIKREPDLLAKKAALIAEFEKLAEDFRAEPGGSRAGRMNRLINLHRRIKYEYDFESSLQIPELPTEFFIAPLKGEPPEEYADRLAQYRAKQEARDLRHQ